jgi:hypothetical protein
MQGLLVEDGQLKALERPGVWAPGDPERCRNIMGFLMDMPLKPRGSVPQSESVASIPFKPGVQGLACIQGENLPRAG